MDLETYTDSNGKLIPYCICCYLEKNIVEIWHSLDIWKDFFEKIISESKTDLIEIYTHNINFDGYVLISYLKETNIHFDMFTRDLNIYWIKIFYLKNIILIRCSYKIIPISVENLGKMINILKKPFPYKFASERNLDYVGVIPDLRYFENYDDYRFYKENFKIFNFKKISLEYCKQDVKIVLIVLKEIIKIIKTYDKTVINKSFSFSSISYKIYIKKYDKFGVDMNKPNLEEYNYYKNSYYGGRCEVFGNPKKNKIIHYFDFKGMYGQCMMEKYPIGKPLFKEKNLDVNEIGFHSIKFKCNDYLPFLPIKSNKLIFSNGTMVGTYWYEEIKHAIENKRCEILEHYSSYVFNSEDYVFKDYVQEMKNIREKGLYYNVLGKNLINGLYGSFALNEENYITLLITSEEEFFSLSNLVDVLKHRKIGNVYMVYIKKNNKASSFLDKKKKWNEGIKRNTAYAAITSSKARIKLNTALNNVIKNGGDLYYTDTDSVYAGFEENRLNQKMGEVEWTNIYEDGIFISSKFYMIKNEKPKIKGIRHVDYDFERLKKEFYENHSNIIFNNQLNIYHTDYNLYSKYVTKTLSLKINDKRKFTTDKKDTTPNEIK